MSFQELWDNARNEVTPDPRGAAGALITRIAEKLDADEVEYAKVAQAAFFLWDLSHLGFKGMELNVVMVAHPPSSREEVQTLSRVLSEYKYAVQSIGYCFVVLLTMEPPPLALDLPSSLDVVRFTGVDLARLCASSAPASVVYEVLSAQVQLQQLCPFNTTREARGSLFKGRKEELDKLTNDRDTSYAVIGARRIGKTSLLCRAHSILRARDEWRPRTHYFNCLTWGDNWDCWDRMAHALDVRKELRIERGARNFSYLLERLSARGQKPLLLFFDEVDRIVDIDSENGWPFFRSLAEATHERWIRIVLAGYRSLARLIEDPEAPYYRAINPMGMTALTHEQAVEALTEPFANMHIALRHEIEFKNHVWRITRGYPFVVQLLGQELFQRASVRSPRASTPEDAQAVEEGDALREFLHTHFLQNTIEHGRSVLAERLCCALLSHEPHGERWVEGQFLDACTRVGLPQSLDDMHAALTNLCRAHILSVDRGAYAFTFPLMQSVLRSAYPDLTLFVQSLTRS